MLKSISGEATKKKVIVSAGLRKGTVFGKSTNIYKGLVSGVDKGPWV